jgi:CzcA family heavy metal efflux pump
VTTPVPWLLAHRRALLLVLGLLVAAGGAALWRMPVALFPQVAFPRVLVSIDAGDHPAERMAIEVTAPLEEALRAVPGVQHQRSVTSRGAAEVSLTFGWGDDMPAALLRAQSAVTQVLPRLPAGTTFDIRRMDPTVFPCLAYSLVSDRQSLAELRAYAQHRLRPLLARVAGVAKVEVLGGDLAEWQVELAPARLQAYGLDLEDVALALQRANVLEAVGRLEDRGKLALVMADAELDTRERLAALVVRQGADGAVRLGDVGRVVLGTAPRWQRVTADGHDAVLVQVYQQPGGNTVAIAAAIRALVGTDQAALPRGAALAAWYDQSELITAAAWSVAEAIAIGVGLAALVLLAFLRNLTITLIALIAVPAVLLATALLLHAAGMSLNIMTLGGMAAAVGLIIDDAIVMVEHLVRRIRARRSAAGAVVLAEAAAFLKPLAGSSAATIVIFVPLAFLSGVTGAFFQALSLTMAIALGWSFLIAWLVVPLLAALLLRQRDADQHEGGRVGAWIQRAYAGLMRRLLPRPALVLLAVVPCAWWGWSSFQRVGTGFMPVMDEGGFILDYRAAPGTSLAETDRLLRQVEAILRATPEVATYSRRTGLQLGGGLTEANEGDFFVRLKAPPRRDVEQVMDEVRGAVLHGVPGLDVEMAQLMEDLIGDLIANPQPIEVILAGEDGAVLDGTAKAVAEALRKVPGVVDVNDGIRVAGDALDIAIDQQRAAQEGVDAEAVARAVSIHLDGQAVTRVRRGPEMIAVRVRAPRSARATPADLAALQVRATDGHLVALERVAALQQLSGQPEIMHEDLARAVAVTARIDQRDLGAAVRDVQALLARPGLVPTGVRWRLGGLYEQQQLAFADLSVTIAVAALLVVVLLVALYESLRIALAVAATTALSLAAVFIGLRLTGTDLNITALMGVTMVVGIVTEIAIIFYSECAALPAESPLAERLIQAGLARMRPITMTILAAILALAPLALGLGQGAAMQQPLAIAIISGLLAQLPLALVVLPALLVALRVR